MFHYHLLGGKMFKLNLNILVVFILFSITSFFAQKDHSVEINGGVLYPRSSSNGFSSSIKYSYSLNSTFNIYTYVGYNSWDKFNVVYAVDLTGPQTKALFQSYSSDNHVLIPIYIGNKINLHTNKLFTSFFDVEIGYSYFNYNSYDNVESVDIHTGEIVDYKIVEDSKIEVTDHLFGIGIGAGLSHPITNSINLIISYRLNSNFNSGDFGLFSAKGTYSTLFTGLNIKL